MNSFDAAFPRPCGRASDLEANLDQPGMSFREYVAVQAMAGLLAGKKPGTVRPPDGELARRAVELADALIAALN
jgi:hypothetical protein